MEATTKSNPLGAISRVEFLSSISQAIRTITTIIDTKTSLTTGTVTSIGKVPMATTVMLRLVTRIDTQVISKTEIIALQVILVDALIRLIDKLPTEVNPT